MLLEAIFPSLYAESAATSAKFFSGMTVKKSHINERCVIVAGNKPLNLFFDYLYEKGYSTSCIDNFIIKGNSDGSISVIEKNEEEDII